MPCFSQWTEKGDEEFYKLLRYVILFTVKNAQSYSKGLCNNYLGGGGGIREGSMEENDNKREGELDVKFNTYRGALLFHSFLQTGKVVEELLEFKYKY